MHWVVIVKARGGSVGIGDVGALFDLPSLPKPPNGPAVATAPRPQGHAKPQVAITSTPKLAKPHRYDTSAIGSLFDTFASSGTSPKKGKNGKRAQDAAPSIFDDFETKHPRAKSEGGSTFNPDTGKEIKPGQFAPKPDTGEEDHDGETDAERVGAAVDERAEGAEARASQGTDGGPQAEEKRDQDAGDREGSRERTDDGPSAAGMEAGGSGEGGPQRGDPEVHSPTTTAVDAECSEPAANAPTQFTPERPVNDYRFAADDTPSGGGWKQRFARNMAAIETLKLVESEGRNATPEEQATLAGFCGWGWAGPNVLDAMADEQFRGRRAFKEEFNKEHEALKALLTPEEFAAARAATTNSHFTSPEVIGAIWEGVRGLGFGDAASMKVLEPSMGHGAFYGYMPDDLHSRARMAGVELDSITGRIAAQLHQSAAVQVTGLQNAKLPDGYFDLAISNVPFSKDVVLSDDSIRKGFSASLHNFFFAKALQKVRPGGVVAFITSRFTMDAADPTVRKYLASQADLLGAVRLPAGAFQGAAATAVDTDVIFLQKRIEGAEPAGDDWTGTSSMQVEGSPHATVGVNDYFHAHPENMLGVMGEGKMFADSAQCVPRPGQDTGALLRDAVSRLPQGVYQPATTSSASDAASDAHMPAPGDVLPGGYTDKDGKVYQEHKGDLVEVTGKDAARIRPMLGIRDTLRSLLIAQSHFAEGGDTTDMEGLRGKLNAQYDDFAKAHGHMVDKANRRAFIEDPDYPFLCALENTDKTGEFTGKADIFAQNTTSSVPRATHADNAHDAMSISLGESGRIDWKRMSDLTGKTEGALQAELADSGKLFRNPTGDWETHDQYLSGDVRAKLAHAEAMAAVDPSYQRNVDALKEIQPAWLEHDQITANLGASWIPTGTIEDFTRHICGRNSSDITVTYEPKFGTWTLNASGLDEHKASVQWGTRDRPAHKLILDALMGKEPKIFGEADENGKKHVDPVATEEARAKTALIREEFRRWVWDDEARADEITDHYNRNYNCFHDRDFDGQHLSLPGLSAIWRAPGKMHHHIRDAVWRILQDGNTLLHHATGAGKTAAMTCAAMEMRRMGLARKPMFVVPNGLVPQWDKEIREIYPDAHVLMTTPDDFKKENRERLIARIAAGDWDAVLVTHSQFGKIGVRPETEQAFMDKQLTDMRASLDEIRASEGGDGGGKGRKSPTQKQTEAAIKKMEGRLKKRLAIEGRSTQVAFEDLGVDHLFVDEADLFKNLYRPSALGNIKGLSNSDSQRATDLFLKAEHVRKVNGGRGLTFATATPISNSLGEMHTMMRYLMPEELEKRGVGAFDSWARSFGEIGNSVERGVDGRWIESRRLSKLVNTPELMHLWRHVSDIRTPDDLNIQVPKMAGGAPMMHDVKVSELQADYLKSLADRCDAIRAGGVDPSDDNALKVLSDGRKAGLDFRLIDPSAPADPNRKAAVCARSVADLYRKHADRSGAQLVFCDLGTPKRKDVGAATVGSPTADTPDVAGDDASEQEYAGSGAGSDSESEALTAEEAQALTHVYGDMKAEMIRNGVPAEQIAFIHDAKTPAQRLAMQEAVNEGSIRVLIGSTEKMGAGMNAQKRLCAIHHLDCPWRPRDLVQRNGRAFRHGNIFDEVEEHRYGMAPEGDQASVDGFMWQTIQQKLTAFNSLMSGKDAARISGDIDMEWNAAKAAALFSGDPRLQKHAEYENEVRRLENLQAAHGEQQRDAKQTLAVLSETIPQAERRTAQLQSFAAHAEAEKGGKRSLTVGGVAFDDQDAANNALRIALDKMNPGETKLLGRYGNTDVVAQLPQNAAARGSGNGKSEVAVYVTPSYDGMQKGTAAALLVQTPNAAGIRAAISNATAQHSRQAGSLDEARTKLAHLQADTGKPFAHTEDLNSARAELKRLSSELEGEAKGKKAGAVDQSVPPTIVTYPSSVSGGSKRHYLNVPQEVPMKVLELLGQAHMRWDDEAGMWAGEGEYGREKYNPEKAQMAADRWMQHASKEHLPLISRPQPETLPHQIATIYYYGKRTYTHTLPREATEEEAQQLRDLGMRQVGDGSKNWAREANYNWEVDRWMQKFNSEAKRAHFGVPVAKSLVVVRRRPSLVIVKAHVRGHWRHVAGRSRYVKPYEADRKTGRAPTIGRGDEGGDLFAEAEKQDEVAPARRWVVIVNSPHRAVHITGKELGEDMDNRELAKAAQVWGRQNLQGKMWRNSHTGRRIFVRRAGVKHLSMSRLSRPAMKAIVGVPAIIENMRYTGSEPDRRGRVNVVAAHKYTAVLDMGGEAHVVHVTSLEDQQGHHYYDHNLTKVEPASSAGGPVHKALASYPPSTGSTVGLTPSASGASRDASGTLMVNPLGSESTILTKACQDGRLARDIARAGRQTDTHPTPAQKEAGNYAKGRFAWNGLEIAIEHPKGSHREGVSPDGEKWRQRVGVHYGYICEAFARATDDDHVDVFVGPHPESDRVFVVNQVDQHGHFDEHKVCIGFRSKREARAGYLSCYEAGWKVGHIAAMDVARFKERLTAGAFAKKRIVKGIVIVKSGPVHFTKEIDEAPDTAPDGMAFRVLWAEGMAGAFYRHKAVAMLRAARLHAQDDLASFRYVRVPKGTSIVKAMQLRGGEWSGHASKPSASPVENPSQYKRGLLASVIQGASTGGPVQHVKSTRDAQGVHGSHVYKFNATNHSAAAEGVRSSLEARGFTHISSGSTKNRSMVKMQGPNGRSVHHFIFRPGATSAPTGTPPPTKSPTSTGWRQIEPLHENTNVASPQPDPTPPQTSPRGGTSGPKVGMGARIRSHFGGGAAKPAAGPSGLADTIHSTVAGLGGLHLNSQTGRKGTSHTYTHANPMRAAMHAYHALTGDTNYENVNSRAVQVGGHTRRQYHFTIAHPETGEQHSVAFQWGAGAMHVPKASAAPAATTAPKISTPKSSTPKATAPPLHPAHADIVSGLTPLFGAKQAKASATHVTAGAAPDAKAEDLMPEAIKHASGMQKAIVIVKSAEFESKHPRRDSGTERGGEFARKEDVGADEVETQNAAKRPIPEVMRQAIRRATVLAPIGQVVPPNDADRKAQLEQLVQSMRKHGWIGRPLLAIQNGDRLEAFTGGHRLAAALAVGIKRIPIYVADRSVLDRLGLTEGMIAGTSPVTKSFERAHEWNAVHLLQTESEPWLERAWEADGDRPWGGA